MRKKCLLVCLLLAALLMIGSSALADHAEVTASSLYLRAAATSDSEALLLLRKGTRVEVLGKSGLWYKVSYGNYTGYVYRDYVTVSDDDTLRKGDKCASVKAVQERLRELGYYKNTCDGSFGNMTVNAVKAFQKKNGLPQDGMVNEATMKKLKSSSAIAANAKTPAATEKKEETKTDDTLKKGASGSEVKKLQQRLKELGYYSASCDGNYGNVTVNAVKAFQKKNGLTQDGVAGATTLKKLNSSSAVAATSKTEKEEAKPETNQADDTLKKGAKGSEVKKLQQRLKELGYYKYGIDSSYGDRTVEAVKAFQKKNGLTQDGVAGATTLKKLNSSSAVPATEKTESKVETKPENNKVDDTLKKGDRGSEVKKLQQRLKELGYYLYGIDSSYGERTVEAVKAFQKKNSLSVDGICGTATLRKLNAASAVPAGNKTEKEEAKEEPKDDGTLKKGSKGDEVKKIQQRLKDLGYYSSSCDGDYGDRTVTAVKAFQTKNGLKADGVCGATTLKKLNSSNAVNAKGATTVILNTAQTLKQGDNGPQVKALQNELKRLGYYTNSLDSNYGQRTVTAVSDFQRANKLTVNGVANSTTLKKIMSSSAISKSEATKIEEETKEQTYKTERLDWFKKGSSVFPRRAIIQIKDVRTGLVFKAQVLYGSNHLDVEPLTKVDTSILLKINGGIDFSWRRRPMLVKFNGHVYAASIYSEPHGDQSIYDNGFDGQFCLHFYGSKTHGTGEVKADHQACIAEAMKATW